MIDNYPIYDIKFEEKEALFNSQTNNQQRGFHMPLVGQPWMRWTFLEAATKAGSKTLQKVVGSTSTGLADLFLVTFIVGLVQTVVGFVIAKKQGKTLLDGPSIWSSVAFGSFAVVSGFLAFLAFQHGADLGVNTFIITLSIIPGAIFDRLFFGKRYSGREILGIVIAVLAGFVVLEISPRTFLPQMFELPIWVWLSFGTMMTVAINQVITQKMKKVDPFVKNFWGGLTAVVIGVAGVALFSKFGIVESFSSGSPKLWASSLAIGAIVVGMWCFNLLAYKDGASIAIKKLVLNGSYLALAIAIGVIAFGEALTLGKGLGLLLFLVAFVFFDKTSWDFFTRKGKSSQSSSL